MTPHSLATSSSRHHPIIVIITISAPESDDFKTRTVGVRDFFLAYRKVDLEADEVLVSVFVPFARADGLEVARAFKQVQCLSVCARMRE